MTPDEIYSAMDGIKVYAEFLGGIRRQLVEEQGFEESIAQALVLEMIRASYRPTAQEGEGE